MSTTRACLVSHGWQSWSDALPTVLEGAEGIWIDVEFCRGQLPDTAPFTDRIHAWTKSGSMFRLRVDDGEVLITELIPAGQCGHQADVANCQQVEVQPGDVQDEKAGARYCVFDTVTSTVLRFVRPAEQLT